MNVGGTIKGVLSAMVGGRVYAATFPQSQLPTWPAIRFTVISETPFPDICGSHDTTADDVGVQLDVVAETYDAMVYLREQVIAAMPTCGVPLVRGTSFQTFDTETRTHRAVLEYTFQPSNSTDSPG